MKSVCPKSVSYSQEASYAFEELWTPIYLFMRLKSVSAVGDSRIEALTENTRKRRAGIEEPEIPLVLSYSRAAAL